MSTSALTPTEDGDLKEQDPSLSEDKVVVLFKPTGGDTPLLKQTKVKVLRSAKFVDVVSHLSRQVKRAHVFVYLNDAFTPSYDEQVGRLDWFGSGSGGEGEFETNGGSARKKKQMLVVNYSAQQAYG
jgi:hypothetical protein